MCYCLFCWLRWFIGPVLDEVFVESQSTIEHVRHIRDVAHVPGPDVLVEHRSAREHAIHTRDAARVPEPDALIKCWSIPEHEHHILVTL